MIEHRKALLLIGSPKGTESTSKSLGSYLLERLGQYGWKTETVALCPTLSSQDGVDELLAAVESAELVVFSFPVYADSLPSVATRALEVMSARRKPGKLPPAALTLLRQAIGLLEQHNIALAVALLRRVTLFLPIYIRVAVIAILSQILERKKVSQQAVSRLKNYVEKLEPKSQRLVGIANSGFPEAKQSQTALSILHEFADETGRVWAGALALGCGASINGRPLDKCGKMVRNVKKALDIAAADLSSGKQVSDEAVNLMAKQLRLPWLYTFFGNLGRRLKFLKSRPVTCRT